MPNDNHLDQILTPKQLKEKKEAEEQEMIKLNKRYSIVLTLLQARILCNLILYERQNPQGQLIPKQYSINDGEVIIPILKELQRIAVIDTNITQAPDDVVLTGKES